MTNLKTKKTRNANHLAYVRTLPCIISHNGQYCNGEPVVAHHLTHVADKGGVALKTGDNYTVSLCWLHHQALHSLGEKKFWRQWNIDAEKEAMRLWEINNLK